MTQYIDITFLIIAALIFTYFYYQFFGKTVKVERVWDGDGFQISIINWPFFWEKRKQAIRIRGIDAPELSQAHGKESRAALCHLIDKKNVRIKVVGKAKGDRLAANVWIGWTNVSAYMVKNGHAWNYAQYGGVFAKAMDKAKKKKLGLWAQANPIPPWEYRHPRQVAKVIKIVEVKKKKGVK